MGSGEQRLRVIAGTHGGRRLVAPRGLATRPTSDRVREALFSRLASMLGPDLGRPSVLDAFAGSGALGIEALSRGADHATFVERDRHALSALRHNLDTLELHGRATVIPGELLVHLSRRSIAGGPFSLLFIDPPYRINKSEVRRAVVALAELGVLSPHAVVVWEHDAAESPEWPSAFEPVGERRYGDTIVDIAIWRGEMTG